MNEPANNPAVRLVNTHLRKAEEELKSHNIGEVQGACTEALKVKGDHPTRKADIRQMLKRYCDDLVEQTTPNWENIHRVMGIIDKLGLKNEETRSFERDIKLKEAQFLLEQQDNLNQSFTIFTDLLTDDDFISHQGKLKEQIAKIVSTYISDRATKQDWPLLERIFNHVQGIWPAGDSIHDWLKTMSQIIKAANQGKATIQADRDQTVKVVEQAKENIQANLNQERKRSKALNYSLVALLCVAAIAYPLAFIL